MDKRIFNESNGLWYELAGDYYLPCLKLPEEEQRPVGIWGQRRKRYLREHRYLGYTFRDAFPLGHGEKSLFLITRHIALTEEEALAIRWHMGAYDDAVKGGSRSMTEAMNLTPWVWRL